jgi:DNA-binding transcriptional LysR family regulator
MGGPAARPKRDLRLLVALDMLLQEESVTGAAERLRLSTPAMSRTLTRLRRTMGDPVLVRAGRGMVPTPRALALRERVHALVLEAESLLSPGSEDLDLSAVRRDFTIATEDGYVSSVAPALTAVVRSQAPNVTLHFLPDDGRRGERLQDGTADLEIGSVDDPSPQRHVERLFQDRYVGVVRQRHVFADGPVALRRFADADHIGISREGPPHDPIDQALTEHGVRRNLTLLVPNRVSALMMVGRTDLVATVPETPARDIAPALKLRAFELPLPTTPVEICMTWHVRLDADPVHAWLRGQVREILADDGPSCRPRSAEG